MGSGWTLSCSSATELVRVLYRTFTFLASYEGSISEPGIIVYHSVLSPRQIRVTKAERAARVRV